MKEWHKVGTPGIIAFVLAAGLSASMVLTIIGMMFRPNSMGDNASVFLSTLFGTVVGAVATYLGQSRERQVAEQPKTPDNQ